MTSATDEVRRLLDERGVRHADYGSTGTFWTGSGNVEWGTEESGRHWTLFSHDLTPARAIDATMGRGTCRDVRSADHTIAFECSECGCWVAYDEYWETGIYVPDETGQEHIRPRYCPNCGRRVEQ